MGRVTWVVFLENTKFQIPLIMQCSLLLTFNVYSTTTPSGIVTLKGAFKINELIKCNKKVGVEVQI